MVKKRYYWNEFFGFGLGLDGNVLGRSNYNCCPSSLMCFYEQKIYAKITIYLIMPQIVKYFAKIFRMRNFSQNTISQVYLLESSELTSLRSNITKIRLFTIIIWIFSEV